MIFIDGTNLDRGCMDRFGRNDIDFEKFLPLLSQGTRLLHTLYVTAPYKRHLDDSAYRRQQGMINHLRRMPNVTVDLQQHRMRDVRCRLCGGMYQSPVEKGTDVAVGIALVEQSVLKAADLLILVSNDSDYGPACRMARQYGRDAGLAYLCGAGEREHQIRLSLAPVWNECNRFIRFDLSAMERCWMQR